MSHELRGRPNRRRRPRFGQFGARDFVRRDALEASASSAGVTSLPEVCVPRLDLQPPDVTGAVAAAAIIADPIRASILAMLADGPHCVCELAAALGQRENNISNHLAKLRDAGLVHATRHEANARFLYYERDEAAVAAARTALEAVLQ